MLEVAIFEVGYNSNDYRNGDQLLAPISVWFQIDDKEYDILKSHCIRKGYLLIRKVDAMELKTFLSEAHKYHKEQQEAELYRRQKFEQEKIRKEKFRLANIERKFKKQEETKLELYKRLQEELKGKV